MKIPSAAFSHSRPHSYGQFQRLALEVLESRLLPGEGVLAAVLSSALAMPSDDSPFDDTRPIADWTVSGTRVALSRGASASPSPALVAVAAAPALKGDHEMAADPAATHATAAPFDGGDEALRNGFQSFPGTGPATSGLVPGAAGAVSPTSGGSTNSLAFNNTLFTPAHFGPSPAAAGQPVAGATDAYAAALLTNRPLAAAPAPSGNAVAPAPDKAQIAQALAAAPVQFEANVGQAAAGEDFVVRTQGYAATLKADGLTYHAEQGNIQVALVGANADARSVASQPQATQVAYFAGGGNPADGGHAFAAPAFGTVEYQNVYPGVNVVYHGDGHGQMEYDFVVAPGADPRSIALDVRGANGVLLDAHGDLVADSAGGFLRQNKPVLYQEVGGARRAVDGAFDLRGTVAHVRVGAYDATRPLVIDPVVFSSFVGGTLGSSAVNAVSVGGAGWVQKVYVTGYLPGPLGFTNLFFSEVDYFAGANTAVVNSVAYFGGTGSSVGRGIATDRANPDIVYVVGTSSAAEFYTKHSLYAVNGQTAVVMRFNTSRAVPSSVDYSVAAAGFGADAGLAVSADYDWWNADPANGGGAFFGISVFSNGVANPYILHLLGPNGVTGPVVGGVHEGVRESVMTDGSAFFWSTPAATSPQIYGIDVATAPTQFRYADGTFDYHVHVIGTAVDLNVVPGAPRPWVGHFVTGHRNSAGVPVVLANLYSTPLGFLGYGTAIAVDPAQVAQRSGLRDNYSVVAAGQALNNVPGGADLWLARFDAFDIGSVQAVFPSPAGLYTAVGLAVEQQRNALGGAAAGVAPGRPAAGLGVAGPGGGPPAPAQLPAVSPNNIYVTGTINRNGTPQAHVTKFLPNLILAQPPVVFGGTGGDVGRGIALANPTQPFGASMVFVGGMTASQDFPVVSPFQPVMAAPRGGTDGFLAALA